MFVTFEGPEGSGKTTQIRLLHDALSARGVAMAVTREPGGTPIGDKIRKILLDGGNRDMVPMCELLLYWAARAQHVEEIIRPALKSGKLVLCDRYTDSTMAYQGFARGIDFKLLADLDRIATQNLKPDLTLLFDLPVEIGLTRAHGRMQGQTGAAREDRFENEELEFHRQVRNGFLELAKKEPERFVVLDATLDCQTLHAQVLKTVTDAL
jgi:dTMP kinase